jgi:WXG100 family type VII secretion target
MSLENIDISLAELSNAASSLRTYNEQLTNKLYEIKAQVDGLQAYWVSEAGETYRNRLTKYSQRFEEYKKVVEDYAKFLDETVKIYDDTETTINSAAAGAEFR